MRPTALTEREKGVNLPDQAYDRLSYALSYKAGESAQSVIPIFRKNKTVFVNDKSQKKDVTRGIIAMDSWTAASTPNKFGDASTCLYESSGGGYYAVPYERHNGQANALMVNGGVKNDKVVSLDGGNYYFLRGADNDATYDGMMARRFKEYFDRSMNRGSVY